MLHVVAMEHKRPLECAKSHQQLDFTVSVECVQITLKAVVQGGLSSVVADNLVRFEVHVNGMPPASAAIAADPAFNRAQLRSCISTQMCG